MLFRVHFNFRDEPEVFEFEASDSEAAARYIGDLLGFCPFCRAALQSRSVSFDSDLC